MVSLFLQAVQNFSPDFTVNANLQSDSDDTVERVYNENNNETEDN